jgi:hypothetical protein
MNKTQSTSPSNAPLVSLEFKVTKPGDPFVTLSVFLPPGLSPKTDKIEIINYLIEHLKDLRELELLHQ